ncbi:unnamed protein product [Rotaria magnacalcarata]|uniref:Uncharacterized protein n=1 Tax=Rotaria magnacalcarata TaxID=392030 RepID=A0A820GBM0_9BILA|nr:unnamed protein product [Rotaria magnacalcarata]
MSKLNYLHHSSSRRSRSRSHHSSSHRSYHSSSHRSYHSSSHRSPSHQQHPSQYSTTNRNHYSIDTESEKTNNQLSLIQINSIPFTPPSLVIHWSSSLTSRHSSLSHVTRMNMIHYATHDVMAVTLLIRPITERWTFE